MTTFRHKYVATLVVALIAIVAMGAVDFMRDDFDLAMAALGDSDTKGAVFGSMFAVAGLILTVSLGLLGIVTSLDDRPIVEKMRKHGFYRELIDRLLGPIVIVIVAGVLAFACLLWPVPEKATSLGLLADVMVALPMALTIGLLVQMARVARLLAKILLHAPAEPTMTTPAEAGARLKAKAPPVRPSRDPDAALAVS